MPNTAAEVAALTDTVSEGPASATVDGRSATAHNIKDLIALEQHRAGQASATAAVPGFGLRFTQLVPPGCG